MAVARWYRNLFLFVELCLVILLPINSAAGTTNTTKKNQQEENNHQPPITNQDQKDEQETQKSVLLWHGTDISGLITGSAAAGYSKPDSQSGSFNISNFNPHFLFSYKDLLLLQSAMDFEIDDLGNTAVSLDMLSLNWFLTDYATFGIGKFESSLGKFVPNLGPDWVNKLPSAPVGFEGDQAAPQSEVGAQFRGGFYLPRCLKVNYVVFIANGPIATADQGIVQQIHTDGYSTNDRGNFVGGARFGILPIPKFEIGVSAALGKVAIFDTAGDLLDKRQDYDVLGADISYQWNNWDLRAEYVQQETHIDPDDLVFSGGIWRAWYTQVAYRFSSRNWEPIVRYGKFKTPFDDQDQQQLAFGIDYWLAPSLVAKIGYEFNEGLGDTANDVNVLRAQLGFGF
ncbi:MAG: hypothetical protein HYX61_01875 [Gammaproteobacteria bacterium]|jgi:hypothetical protein|nr:hypothetical protein [Gammaproteobacteria bacterium]